MLWKIENSPCKRTFHFSWESSGLRKQQTSAHSPGTAPGHHNGGRPGGTGRFVSVKASSIVLMSFRSLPHGQRQTAPSKSPATKFTCSSSITARIARSNLFPIPRFLANWLLMSIDIAVTNVLRLRGSRRNDAREFTLCNTHNDCPSFTSYCCLSLVSWRYTDETLMSE